jgi:hypothetical protein
MEITGTWSVFSPSRRRCVSRSPKKSDFAVAKNRVSTVDRFPFCQKNFFNGDNRTVGAGMKKPYCDFIGRRFGRLVVVEYAGVTDSGSMWRFGCDCGAMREASMSTVKRKRCPIRSCGCVRREISENAYEGSLGSAGYLCALRKT